MEKKVSITGDLTTMNALDWKEKLNGFAQEFNHLEIDLTGVTDADIIGVNALVTTHKILTKKGNQLKIKISGSSKISEMLHLTKFQSIFNTTVI